MLLTEAGQPNLGHLLGERYKSAGVLVALGRDDLAAAAGGFVEAMTDPVERWFLIVPWSGMALHLVIYLLSMAGLLKQRAASAGQLCSCWQRSCSSS